MSYELKQDLKQSLNIKQLQRLIMTPQMQQALNLLQLPVMELSALIETEMEQNPLIEQAQESPEIDLDSISAEMEIEEQEEELKSPVEKELNFNDEDFQILRQLDDEFKDHFKESGTYQKTQEDDKYQTFLESSIHSEQTLYESLMQQTRETLSSELELKMAEAIIGNLDNNGLLLTPLKEIAILNDFDLDALTSILSIIQDFQPPGIAATSFQQSLLFQLNRKDKQETLAYKIVERHFQDLLHNRIPTIQRDLQCSAAEICSAIHDDIAKLDLHPGSSFFKEITQPIVPDLSIVLDEKGKLKVIVTDEYIPTIRFNRRYLNMIDDKAISIETKDFIKQKLMSAKWLIRNIYQRGETLEKIGNFLIENQEDFFSNPSGKLVPLTMKALAEVINVHESTVARAVSNKYLTCTRGIFLLKSFFTNTIETDKGVNISSKTVKDLVLDILENEDKKKPLSDQEVSHMIKAQGIHCARRTVAKYRQFLKIGNAHQRKKFH